MNESTASSRERLKQPTDTLSGVGQRREPLLTRLGLHTVQDLLFYFPRDYEPVAPLSQVADLVADRESRVSGVVVDIGLKNTGPGRSLLAVLIKCDREHVRGLWFNQPYRRANFDIGQRVVFAGKAQHRDLQWQMVHPRVHWLDEEETPAPAGIRPKYGLTEGLSQYAIQKIVTQAVTTYSQYLPEVFPEPFRSTHSLPTIQQAIRSIHHPQDTDDLEGARRRFIFQELLALQTAMALRRQQQQAQTQATPLPCTKKIDERIRRLFPFPLTEDQNQAVLEIAKDMSRAFPMHRLLQGDVGCGKTVVAEYAMLLAIAHGAQAILMVPTEILARQHSQTLQRDLRESRVRLALMTGAQSKAERAEVESRIQQGDIDLLVATQAILHSHVKFPKLGLVVIDEQHRFGVLQRATLKTVGPTPHYLVMTATPIPRTVAISAYGDLDVSTLSAPPPGRQAVHTYVGRAPQRDAWWEFVRKKLREGRQAYVVAPFVDSECDNNELPHDPAPSESPSESDSEAERAATTSAEGLFEMLCNGPLTDFRVDLIHGRMSHSDQAAVMTEFRAGRTQVLVATSIIEIGVDIPNATIMTIEGAERFGLAQLHQLRGRISRGTFPGFVCLYPTRENEEAVQRLERFAETQNGFEIAELDFQWRGPGDLLGTRQHGLPPLRIADLQRDEQVMLEVRQIATELVSSHALTQSPAWRLFLDYVIRRYGEALQLADVG